MQIPVIPWIQPRQQLVRKHQRLKKSLPIRVIIFGCVVVAVGANVFFLVHLWRNDDALRAKAQPDSKTAILPQAGIQKRTTSTKSSNAQCEFRHYPLHRYYKLQEKEQPDFLVKDAEYIYGQWPLLLSGFETQRKLCVDQSEWLPHKTEEQPFADGTNPSILSVTHIQKHMQRMSSSKSDWLKAFPTAKYIATACMTNSQCQWKDSEEEMKEYHLSRLDKPTTVRTVLLVLDDTFDVLAQATIYLERDAQWGKRIKKEKDAHGQPKQTIQAFDDARLFLFDGRIWVSYREGPGFGWEDQVLNPIHFHVHHHKLTTIVKASETEHFCCGRNMALMENFQEPSQLQSLTWVDPVTVIDVKLEHATSEHRRLARNAKVKRSHIHGTNSFMVYLEGRNEFLGIAHFHRPHDRTSNPYARFGHHYTHAFYTISAQAPFELKALSQEFVLQSPIHTDDAEIIQFASGLEVDDNEVVIAYGVNDCEAGVLTLQLQSIEELLRPVESGKQVIDFMQPLQQG